MTLDKKRVLYLTGVSGSGKSTIGLLLSEELGIPFFDGDDFHPESNKQKMASGNPLTDEDRKDWLIDLNKLAKEELTKKGCIIACSALKEKYRILLKSSIEKNVKWIFLDGSYKQILERMNKRADHFMPTSLLQSQFDVLEPFKNAIQVPISKSPDTIVKIIAEALNKSDFGLIGLGVMGKSLCRNLARNGFKISMYNRHLPDKEENIARQFRNDFPELKDSNPFDQLEDFVNSLQTPRKIMLMVNAGAPVDAVINDLISFLNPGDIIIDGGNSHYQDTQNRYLKLKEQGFHFLGIGVSGGEEGALYGPSMMPGGTEEAYDTVKLYLESIAAKDKNGKPCCKYLGIGGSGHFIKMVHNGIEYSEMQLIAEVYYILRKGLDKNPDEIATIFESWNKTAVSNYLLEITVQILRKKENDQWLIDTILDKAGNKGTGNWTTVAAAQLGIPITMLTAALYSRYVSSFKDLRKDASTIYSSSNKKPIDISIEEIKEAYQLARIINHHQGVVLLKEASKAYKWDLKLSEICRVWTNGCIIRSSFMEELVSMLKEQDTILLNKKSIKKVKELYPVLSLVVSKSILNNFSIPCLSAAINYLNGYIENDSNANIIQAQRDFFGAHTYQKKDDPSERFYHTNWNSN